LSREETAVLELLTPLIGKDNGATNIPDDLCRSVAASWRAERRPIVFQKLSRGPGGNQMREVRQRTILFRHALAHGLDAGRSAERFTSGSSGRDLNLATKLHDTNGSKFDGQSRGIE